MGRLATRQQYWLRGAVGYFVSSNDEEPDFDSPIGIEDDVEILNACLQFAELDSLCLRVEDFDDVKALSEKDPFGRVPYGVVLDGLSLKGCEWLSRRLVVDQPGASEVGVQRYPTASRMIHLD